MFQVFERMFQVFECTFQVFERKIYPGEDSFSLGEQKLFPPGGGGKQFPGQIRSKCFFPLRLGQMDIETERGANPDGSPLALY